MAADPQLTFQRGDVISRKYEIEDVLGVGTFGATYLARHIATNRHVVVKFIQPKLVATPAARERLQEGFAKAKNLRHPNIVRYGELNEHEGLIYVTEEYFQAETLRQVIQQHISSSEPFTLQDACQIVIKVLEALEVGHESGIFHRDIKPENILVRTQRSGPGGSRIVRTIKLTDLGIADMVDGTLLGDRFDSGYDSTYMAPELVHFGQAGTSQADIYSVGVILYELLCGQVPRGTFFSPTQVRDDLPEHVDQIVELALSPDAGDRYPSPKDMILDIQRSFNIDSQVGGGGSKGFRTMMIGLAIAVLAVVGGGIYSNVVKEDPIEVAKRQDELWRKKVQMENVLPDEATIRAMQEKHPEMSYVPAGPYLMGRLNVEAGFAPPTEPSGKTMNLSAYYIDRFEFPNRPGELPAGKVTFKSAEEACAKVGKRLCQAEEWEKACKGFPNFIYAYGDTYDPSMCGGGMEVPYKLGERKDCVSPYGVYDMSGGFREWTATTPPTKTDSRKLVKGGLRGSDELGSRCAFAVDEDVEYSEATLTFRCCLDADK